MERLKSIIKNIFKRDNSLKERVKVINSLLNYKFHVAIDNEFYEICKKKYSAIFYDKYLYHAGNIPVGKIIVASSYTELYTAPIISFQQAEKYLKLKAFL